MSSTPARKAYPSDVSDEEWSLVAPYLTLMTETAPQREYPMRELLNALRYLVRYGVAWRAMPNDFPPWSAVYQQTQRWLAAGCFDTLAQNLRAILRLAAGRNEEPTKAIIDSRTLRSTPESGPRAGYDGAKRKRGSKVHLAVDTLGHLLALHVTPTDMGDRQAVARLAADTQEATGETVSLAYVDQGYTGDKAAEAAAAEGITLEVVKLPETKRGFVLLPRRWIVERPFAWATVPPTCQRLRAICETLAGLHVVAFVGYMLKHAALMRSA
jgi:transposase